MQVYESQLGQYLVVEVRENRLDARIALSIKNYLIEKFDQGTFNLVIDLKEVNFIDSSALGAFVTALKLLGNRGSLVLAGVNENVMEIFRLTRMDRIFQIFETASDAVNAAPIA